MTTFSPALLTDLYQLTMLQAYAEEQMNETAVFSLFVRRMPEQRNYLLACGLETIVDALETLCFSADDIAYLASLGKFPGPFLGQLSTFRFTGDVDAVAAARARTINAIRFMRVSSTGGTMPPLPPSTPCPGVR